MNLIDLTGQKFGRLTVIERSPRRGDQAFWICKCDCGNTTTSSGNDLRRRGDKQGCGCLSLAQVTHGHTDSPSYASWEAMIRRCESPGSASYQYYGGRGISVCNRWRESFSAFLVDMGERPPGMTLDRIDPNGNYEPGNCRWATPVEQGRNTRRVKLNPVIVAEIRRRAASGDRACIIASSLGISRYTIGDVLHGRTWRSP